MTPRISIIINTLNRASHLDDALRALQGLRYPAFEVIVVNGPSTDDTEAVLARWADKVRTASCDEANLSISRNVGVAAAAGDIICFIDDDAAPHPEWLTNLAGAFLDPGVGGVGGFTIDNTGVRWQVRKTVCDRFGNAFNVSPMFDERPLSRPGSAYYPSLLGTNCAFRAEALRGIGGFDHAFAYLLDETDVCLRLVDAGWKVIYEPTALVYHQFAPSHIRSADRVARTLYPSAVSKGYFIMRHGARQSLTEAGAEVHRYRTEILEANDWLQRHDRIDPAHRYSLDQDLVTGIEDGVALAGRKGGAPGGDLAGPQAAAKAFKAFPARQGLTLAMVSQDFPPGVEAGIARWSELTARGLAARGHQVHVLTRARPGEEETVSFKDGLWLHEMVADEAAAGPIAEAYGLPASIAAWGARVWREAQHLKSFGLQAASFPIWDLEGLPLLDDPDIPTLVSLHTTYAMAKPFKAEWSARPLFEATHVDRVIAAEGETLRRAPVLLANSQAVITAIEAAYGIDVSGRSVLAPHGVPDPLVTRSGRARARDEAVAGGAALRVLFVGRFEARKGFDIAARAAAHLSAQGAEVIFVGDHLTAAHRSELAGLGLAELDTRPGIRFLGAVDREALDDALADCDIVLIPSRFESFGLVAIEAMASGRPVFSLSVGGVADIVEDGVTGRLWPESPELPALIAEAVAGLAADRGRLAAMGRAARAAYEAHYTVEAMIDAVEAVFRTLAASKVKEAGA